MNTPYEIIETLGKDAVMAAVGVKESAVFNACKRGELPASWYAALDILANANEHILPRSAFAFKGETAA